MSRLNNFRKNVLEQMRLNTQLYKTFYNKKVAFFPAYVPTPKLEL